MLKRIPPGWLSHLGRSNCCLFELVNYCIVPTRYKCNWEIQMDHEQTDRNNALAIINPQQYYCTDLEKLSNKLVWCWKVNAVNLCKSIKHATHSCRNTFPIRLCRLIHLLFIHSMNNKKENSKLFLWQTELENISFLRRSHIACNAECCNSCLSVCPSITRWYPIQTNEDRIMRSLLWGSKKHFRLWVGL